MKIITLIYLFFTFLEFGCNQPISKEEAKNELQTLLNMPISYNFFITDYKEDAAIGADFTKIFVVHFNHEDYNEIFNKVNPQRFKNIDVELYGYSITKGNKRISAIFNPQKNTIKYTYNTE